MWVLLMVVWMCVCWMLEFPRVNGWKVRAKRVVMMVMRRLGLRLGMPAGMQHGPRRSGLAGL